MWMRAGMQPSPAKVDPASRFDKRGYDAAERGGVMADAVLYEQGGAVAFITLNRPDRLNAINGELVRGLRESVDRANREREARVIVLRGAGRSFCAGYDLQTSPEYEAAVQERSGGWDPVLDFRGMSENVRAFMSLWESRKPVIAQVHGWCVGGGTDLALCSDVIYAAEDTRIGYPPSRVWGTPTTCMWVYRLGLEHAKRLMLTGEAVDGREAERIGLVSRAVPAEQLAEEVESFAAKLATTPTNQLVMNKLLVNQAYENMGLRTTQMLGTFLDGIARHTPEGVAWRQLAIDEGFGEAVRRRDAPWRDYSARS
jgi:enoyl-CoA hydratase